MDGERVIASPSEEADEAGRAQKDPTLTYTKVFNDLFPYYLSIGMSSDEFWRGDVFLAKAYRKAQRLREDMMNQQYWLQGMYFYEAICDASPIFNPYAKRGTKPHPYLMHEGRTCDGVDALLWQGVGEQGLKPQVAE